MIKNQVILLILVVLLLGGGAFSLRKNSSVTQNNTENSTTPAQTEGNTVLYSKSGFSPKTLTVKTGTTVRFENQSSFPMWVGSDPHPTHTNSPQFDQKTSGNNYSFTFDKVGSYPFHNHMNPSQGGAIVVK